MHDRRQTLAIALILLFALPHCAARSQTSKAAPPPLAPDALRGAWQMDLSPAHDGSYRKEFVVTPPATAGAKGGTFEGSVYGGSPFDNGQTLVVEGRLVFSFVSDEAGQQGGPYYWLGTLDRGGRMEGRVRSLKRGLDMMWSATRR